MDSVSAKKMIDVDDSREFAIVEPTKILNELRNLSKEKKIDHFAGNENQIMFFCDTFRMVSKLYKGIILIIERCFPENIKQHVLLIINLF